MQEQDVLLKLVQNSPFGVYLIDSEFRLAFVGAGARRVFAGIEPLIGRDFGEVLRIIWPEPFASEAIDRFRHTLATGEPYRANNTLEHRANIDAMEAYDWKIERLTLDNGSHAVVCHFYDATELREAERKLRESEVRVRSEAINAQARLIAAFNGSPAFICVLRGPEHVYEFANDAIYTLLGKRDLIGLPVRQAVPELADQGFFAMLDRVYATGEPFIGREMPALLHRHPGQPPEQRWMDFTYQPIREADGSVSGIFCHGVDVTERREADARLRASEDRAAFVRTSSGVGFWYCDLPFDQLEWDERVKAHFHLPPDASVAIQTFYDRIHPEDRERTRQAIEQSIAGHTPYGVDYRTVNPDTGAVKWIRAIGRTFYADDGTPTRFDGVTLDVTDQKRDMESLSEARAAAEHASHAKDRFLAVLSHELRTPLTPVVMTLGALEYDPTTPPAVREHLEMIKRNVNLEIKLIDDLLDVSRVISGKLRLKLEMVDVPLAVHHACTTCMDAAHEKHIRVECKIPDSSLRIHADPTRLQQVLLNLLRNAIKFTPDGGRVLLTVTANVETVVIAVKDNGIGIAAESLGKIFNAFEQAGEGITQSFGGMGLGLAITRSLVEMHGGSIDVESKGKDQGATFTVRLPLLATSEKESKELADYRSTARDNSKRALRILLVEDHVDTAHVLSMILNSRGHKVTARHSAADALRTASGEQFDVIVSDIGLPDATGYDLVKQILSAYQTSGSSRPKAIAMSGYGTDEDREKSTLAGFDAHLVKPVSLEELEEAVNRLTR